MCAQLSGEGNLGREDEQIAATPAGREVKEQEREGRRYSLRSTARFFCRVAFGSLLPPHAMDVSCSSPAKLTAAQRARQAAAAASASADAAAASSSSSAAAHLPSAPSRLIALPSVLLLLLCSRWLTDADVMSLASGCTSFLCALRDAYALKAECDVQLVQRLSLPVARDRIGKITIGYADRLLAENVFAQDWNHRGQTYLLPQGRVYQWSRQIPVLQSCVRATEIRFGRQSRHMPNEGWTSPMLGFVCPPSITRITHDVAFDQPLTQAFLPKGLTALQLPGPAQRCLAEVQLPTTLRELCLGPCPQPAYPMRHLEVHRLVNLETLVLGAPDTLVGVEWPPSLTRLEISITPKTRGQLVIPRSLLVLCLMMFSPPLHTLRLPSGLRTLRLSDAVFCADGHNSLAGLLFPPSLTELAVGMAREATLWTECCPLPNSLRILRSSTAGAPMPPNLTRLDLSSVPADAQFPDSITQLDFHVGVQPLWPASVAAVHWPRSLTTLEFDSVPPLAGIQLPPALSYLRLGEMRAERGFRSWMRVDPTGPSQPIAALRLPETLRTLDIGGAFRHPLAGIKLPNALRSFRLHSDAFNQSLSDVHFPPQLQRMDLQISTATSSIARLVFPPALTYLRIEQAQVGDLASLLLPAPLRVLRMQCGDVAPNLAGLRLPAALEEFRLSNQKLDEPLDALKLPRSLLALHLCLPACTHSFADMTLPPRLRMLSLDAPPSSRFQNALLPPSLTELHLTSYTACLPVALLQRFTYVKKLIFLATDSAQGLGTMTAQMRLPAGLEVLQLANASPIQPLLKHLPRSLVRFLVRSEKSQLMPIEDLNEITPELLPNLSVLWLGPDCHRVGHTYLGLPEPPIEPIASDWIERNPRLQTRFWRNDTFEVDPSARA